MIVVPYKAEHLLALKVQPGQAYCLKYVTPEYAQQLESAHAFTALEGEQVLAVGGVMEIWENRGLAWTFIDRRDGGWFPALFKAIKRFLSEVPYRRIEAETACEFEQGHRMLRMLGFHLEAECMEAFRVDGGNSALYALVKHG
jgi:hypothetical protein